MPGGSANGDSKFCLHTYFRTMIVKACVVIKLILNITLVLDKLREM